MRDSFAVQTWGTFGEKWGREPLGEITVHRTYPDTRAEAVGKSIARRLRLEVVTACADGLDVDADGSYSYEHFRWTLGYANPRSLGGGWCPVAEVWAAIPTT